VGQEVPVGWLCWSAVFVVCRRYWRGNLRSVRTLATAQGGTYLDRTNVVAAGGQVRSLLSLIGCLGNGEDHPRSFGVKIPPADLKPEFPSQAREFTLDLPPARALPAGDKARDHGAFRPAQALRIAQHDCGIANSLRTPGGSRTHTVPILSLSRGLDAGIRWRPLSAAYARTGIR